MASKNEIRAISENFVFGDTAAKLIGSLPANAAIVRAYAVVSTAFDSGTSNVIDIGTSGDPDHFVNDIDVKTSAGVIAGTVIAGTAGVQDADGSTEIYATHVPVGTAATAGACEVVVEFYQK